MEIESPKQQNKVATTAQALEVSHEFLSSSSYHCTLFKHGVSSEVMIFCQIVWQQIVTWECLRIANMLQFFENIYNLSCTLHEIVPPTHPANMAPKLEMTHSGELKPMMHTPWLCSRPSQRERELVMLLRSDSHQQLYSESNTNFKGSYYLQRILLGVF